jgi:hypothetical protein
VRAAAIGQFFDVFVKNAKESYTVGALTCVDEMLVGFRGRCAFKMYTPSKPEKYGIKVMALIDARTNYFYNAYTGVPKKVHSSLIYRRILIIYTPNTPNQMVVSRLQNGLINSRIAPRASRLNCQNIFFSNGITYFFLVILIETFF